MKNKQKNFVVLLHGTKGAGKTTVNNILKEKLNLVAFFGVDSIRNLVTKTSIDDESAKMATSVMLGMIDNFLKQNISIVLDSGLTEERLESIDEICIKNNVKVFKYFLTAPKDELWKRVKKREIKNGKEPNKERFEYVYNIVYKNKFDEFFEIDTFKYSPKEVAGIILNNMK